MNANHGEKSKLSKKAQGLSTLLSICDQQTFILIIIRLKQNFSVALSQFSTIINYPRKSSRCPEFRVRVWYRV